MTHAHTCMHVYRHTLTHCVLHMQGVDVYGLKYMSEDVYFVKVCGSVKVVWLKCWMLQGN